MKIGEIKIQSLLLMYPSASVIYDETCDESINDAVFKLKADGSLGAIVEASVGAINRALSYFEEKGLSQKDCKDFSLRDAEKTITGDIKIPLDKEALYVEELWAFDGGRGWQTEFMQIGDYVITSTRAQRYTVIYRRKIPKITSITADSCELSLEDSLCQIIPYFVKADLTRSENEELSRESMELFEKRAEAYAQRQVPCQGCVLTVYSQ